jgi:NADH-quinone oxidoreductase subunit A
LESSEALALVAAQYAVVAVFAAVGLAFLIAILLFSWLLRPHRPGEAKLGTYECGNEPIGSPWARFNFRYYIFALLFLLFDVETAYLYPWAVRLRALRALGLFAVIEMFIFIGILALGLVYAWRKGALEWQ